MAVSVCNICYENNKLKITHFKCFCGKEFKNGALYKSHSINCDIYKSCKDLYLSYDFLYDLHVNKKLTNSEIYQQYPYTNFLSSDISETKKFNLPVNRITKLNRRLSLNEINEILSYNFLYQKYVVENLNIVEICKLLNNEFDFSVIKTRIKKYGISLKSLSEIHKCERVLLKNKETTLNRYGVENPNQSSIVKDKIKKTCIQRYGVDHISKSFYFKEKVKETSLERYGVDNAFKSEIVRSKYKDTLLQKYGVVNPSQVQEFQDKKIDTWKNKYGTTHPMKNVSVRQKAKITLVNHLGVTSPLKSLEVQEKQKKTCIQRYGVENPIMNPEIKAKALKSMGENSHCFSRVSISLFNEISKRFDEEISCDFNYNSHGKEIIIKDDRRKSCYCLDFSYVKDNIKIDIEYNGDYWHRNPKFYKSNDPAPFPTQRMSTSKDIWEFDEQRKQYIQSKGFDILTVWESDYLANKERVIQECVDFIRSRIDGTKLTKM